MNLDYLKSEICRQICIPQENYELAKAHAIKIDELLGFRTFEIEKALESSHVAAKSEINQQFWYGLDIQSLQTPYAEVLEMINQLQPKAGDLWLDLGAGYGRMGVVLGLLFPEVKFIGYEFVSERVAEANRIFNNWQIKSARIKKADISTASFFIESANVYFIYDFGSKRDVIKVLEKLAEKATQGPICVIARGRGVRNWILTDFAWLSEINPPVHFTNWSVFRS